MRNLLSIRKKSCGSELPADASGPVADQFPSGLKLLYEPQSPAAVDIVFIHGLNGDREKTWTAPGNIRSWPQGLLPEKLPEARILTFGFDVRIIKWGGNLSNNRIGNHAQNLLHDLAGYREESNTNERPLLFVCHSLGGILCEDALVAAKQRPEPHLRSIFSFTRGIAFLGTPHNGTQIAVVADRLSQVLGLVRQTNNDIARLLSHNSEVHIRIQESFHTAVHHRGEDGLAPIRITCFYEELPMPRVNRLIVEHHSATLPMYPSIGIRASHSEMTKFASVDDPGFKALSGELKRWASDANSHKGSTLNKANPQPGRKAKPIFHVPFRRNKRFISRETVSSELTRRLFVDEQDVVALVGLGGVGKTQTALDLAYWVQQTKPDCSVIWLPALSLAGFHQACRKLIEKLPEEYRNEEDDPKALVQRYFSSQDAGPWLLVIDNGDDKHEILGSSDGDRENTIHPNLPQSSEGRTLFTTRERKIAVQVAGTEVIHMPLMDNEEALEMVRKSLVDKEQLSNRNTVQGLLQKVEGLPLAIAQAANYMNLNNVSIRRYVQLCNNTEEDMVELLGSSIHSDTSYDINQAAVATTWLVSFERIRATDELATQVLSFISWIEPKDIPRSILLQDKYSSEQQLTQAIGTLCGYGFLSSSEDQDILQMHSLVHLITKRWVRQSQLDHVTKQRFLSHMASIFPSDKWESRKIWRQYTPHALKLFHLLKSASADEAITLGGSIAGCLRLDGHYAQALEVRKRMMAIVETRPKDDPERISAQRGLAMAHADYGQVQAAVHILQEISLRNQASTFESDSEAQLETYHSLAMMYRQDGKPQRAISMLETVIEGQALLLAEDHSSLLSSQHTLAMAYTDNGLFDNAIELLQHVVLKRGTLAADHPHLLMSQNALAMAYRHNGQVYAAIDCLRKMLEQAEKTREEDHPDLLAAQYALAMAYTDDQQNKNAIDLLEHVVLLEGESLAVDHHRRLASQHALAIAYRQNGQLQDSIDLLEHVVALRNSLTEDHPKRLASQCALAVAYTDNNQLAAAIPLLEHVVAKRKSLAEDHHQRLMAQHALAVAYTKNGQVQQGIDLLQQVVAIKTSLKEDHQSRLKSESELALAYLADGNYPDALTLLQHVTTLEEEILAEDHPDRLLAEARLGRALSKNGGLDRAISMLQKVVEFGERVLPEGHLTRVEAELYLQECISAHHVPQGSSKC